jgi:hypothetical protein
VKQLVSSGIGKILCFTPFRPKHQTCRGAACCAHPQGNLDTDPPKTKKPELLTFWLFRGCEKECA